jgi:hypothetical protein
LLSGVLSDRACTEARSARRADPSQTSRIARRST